jgi:hypothetical protein
MKGWGVIAVYLLAAVLLTALCIWGVSQALPL